jgi:hypothetical protein
MSAAWLDPSKTDAWLLLVPLYLEQHKLAEAASAAFSALEFDPKRLEAHLAVAATLCHLGVVGVGDSIFRATIPRLPLALRADFERAAPLPPDPTLTEGAASREGGSSPSARGEAEASVATLDATDEDRLWSWSRLTEKYVLLPADQRARSRSASALQRRQEGQRFEWSRRGSGDGQPQGALWVSDELGIRMEILGRLLACRADLSESRARDGAAPPSVALAAMYGRILAALGGARPEGGSPAADARVDAKK